MVQLDKKFADRVEQMQAQFLTMQEAFNTLKSSFYDSKLEQEKDLKDDKLEDTVTSAVEDVIQRETQKIREDISKDIEKNNESFVIQMGQLMQVQ